MALSNILREPRREITETAVGLVAAGGLICFIIIPDYYFAFWWYEFTGGKNGGCPWQIGLILGVLFLFCATLMLAGVHRLGDGICNLLQRRGIHLRPRERY